MSLLRERTLYRERRKEQHRWRVSRWRPKQHANCHLQQGELLELRDLRGDAPRELVGSEFPVAAEETEEG